MYIIDMVDQVCLDISWKLQKKNVKTPLGSSPPLSPSPKTPVSFPNFRSHFMLHMSSTSSNESYDDFWGGLTKIMQKFEYEKTQQDDRLIWSHLPHEW